MVTYYKHKKINQKPIYNYYVPVASLKTPLCLLTSGKNFHQHFLHTWHKASLFVAHYLKANCYQSLLMDWWKLKSFSELHQCFHRCLQVLSKWMLHLWINRWSHFSWFSCANVWRICLSRCLSCKHMISMIHWWFSISQYSCAFVINITHHPQDDSFPEEVGHDIGATEIYYC